jgi:hypothetical protein
MFIGSNNSVKPSSMTEGGADTMAGRAVPTALGGVCDKDETSSAR